MMYPENITINWHVDDVLEIAEQTEQRLSHADALIVLWRLKVGHDANYGITNEIVAETIRVYLKEAQV